MGALERYTVTEVAVALVRAKGLRTVAGVLLGCSEKTVRNYVKRHPELLEVIEDASAEMLDLAEARLMRMIEEGNLAAIMFYLKSKGQARGYGRKPPAGLVS